MTPELIVQLATWHRSTMDVFSIIRSSLVSDGVNPIGQYYRLVKQSGAAGQEMVWKIYDAVRIKDGKVSTSSIFSKQCVVVSDSIITTVQSSKTSQHQSIISASNLDLKNLANWFLFCRYEVRISIHRMTSYTNDTHKN